MFMKFGQQFEINKMFVCTTFGGNMSGEFGFRTPNPPRKFDEKACHIQKRHEHGKKYFILLYVLDIFHPYQPSFGRDEFFVFLPKSLYALLLNRKPSKSNFCVKLLSYKCSFVSLKFLSHPPPREPRQNGAPKINCMNK